jgi:3-hydroxyisobutyrate dehydrogenase-like beta-hydroxyacid dehydrogenase
MKLVYIGFGEAAYHIARGLHGEGLEDMTAFDVGLKNPKIAPVIRQRAQEAKVLLVEDRKEAIEDAAYVLSLTSAGVASVVAEEILPLMESGQIFLDLNSAAPEVKRRIAALPRKEGVLVVDAAVLGPVPLSGHKVPIALAGEGAQSFYDTMTPYGMNLEVIDAPVGGASAIKMLRSVFMKGFPQVLLECTLAARHYGVLEKILDSLEATIGGKSVRQMATQVFTPTVIHAARRAGEMGEVITMLDDLGMESSMSTAAKKRLENLAELHIVDEIGIDASLQYGEIIDLILRYQSREKFLEK